MDGNYKQLKVKKMKKILYFVFAALALVACEPNNGAIEKVRIGVSLDDNTQPAKGPQRISAIDGATDIDINWEKGDVLYYAADVNSIVNYKYFTLISGEGSQTAVFECNDFEFEGESFNLYYHGLADPLGVQGEEAMNPNFTSPIPRDQTCTLNDNGKTVINNDYLVYKGIGCKIGSGIKLNPDFSLVGIILQGVGGFGSKVGIGTSFESAQNTTSWLCGMSSGTVVDLANNPIYYIVLPANYDLTDHKIRLATSRGHNMSNELDLPSVTLEPGVAQIFRIKLTRKEGSQIGDNDAYSIAKVTTVTE